MKGPSFPLPSSVPLPPSLPIPPPNQQALVLHTGSSEGCGDPRQRHLTALRGMDRPGGPGGGGVAANHVVPGEQADAGQSWGRVLGRGHVRDPTQVGSRLPPGEERTVETVVNLEGPGQVPGSTHAVPHHPGSELLGAGPFTLLKLIRCRDPCPGASEGTRPLLSKPAFCISTQ